jgi:transcriptional regulator with XRE-family HTH domain
MAKVVSATAKSLRLPLRDVVSANIKALRLRRGYSQEELAERCGFHRTYVGSVERGERNITLSTLESFATALEVDPRELLKVD